MQSEAEVLKNISLILAEQAGRTFEPVDAVISSVVADVATEGVTDSASFDVKMAASKVNQLLRGKLTGVQQLDAVAVILSLIHI